MLSYDKLENILGVSFKDKALLCQALTHTSYLHEHPDGVNVSNERLEYLGDALVGLVIARHLYDVFPDAEEGALTVMRSELVKGSSLAEVAFSFDLGDFLLFGRGEESSGGRSRLSNLAAAFEALTGAILIDQGYETARKFVLRGLDARISTLAKWTGTENAKSLLQELAQSASDGFPTYRIVDESGAEHARWFTAEVIVADRVTGRGSGPRKSVAEQEAARSALRHMGHDA